MATTVTYKGQTLATVENQTKTLQTAGTWCEDDFTLTDVTQGGGGDDYLAQSLMNTLTSYSSDDVTGTLPNRSFLNRTNLRSISLPYVTGGGEYDFAGCTNLETVNLPLVTVIRYCMFQNCKKLVSFDFSNITEMANGNMFEGCTLLEEVYAPNCTRLGTGNTGAFKNCTSLKFCRVPLNGEYGGRGELFNGDTNLKLVDLGKPTSIATNVFKNCTSLEVLILRRTSAITSLSNVNSFDGITQNVKVYVPSSLKSTYENASNWSTLVSGGIITFYDLEGSPYEDTDFVYMGVPA